jgi:hypothetical protein
VTPDVVIVDGPPLPGEENDARPLVLVFADPWPGPVTVSAGADASDLSVRGQVARPCTMGRLTGALYPHVSGRWQEASAWVEDVTGALSSRAEASVLNGANAALVETEEGWELLQYQMAELVGEAAWKLSGLLRGQQGSEPAMALGAAAGSRIVFLTGAEARADLADWERGLTLEWRAWRRMPEENTAWTGEFEHTGAGLRAWSPAHLAAEWSDDDLALAWIRRARVGGDPWLPGEPPMEAVEGYRVRVTSGGVPLREWDVAETSSVYEAADRLVDFPAGGTALIEVAHLCGDGEPGAWAGLNLTIPAP